MDPQASNGRFDNRRPIGYNQRSPAVRWVKEWVPQEVATGGGKCLLLKWVTEDTLKALKEKENRAETAEPEPTTEVLFLCSFDRCGKTFFDVGALKKHAHIHGERQYVCKYEACGKKFLDSSKLKRHYLSHTGEKAFICPHEGCGKAFSLIFNLRSHQKTHSQDNYYPCPFSECGKRYTHEYKLNNHLSSRHNKIELELPKYAVAPVTEKPPKPSKPSATPSTQASSDRPFACPYDGCDKAYIHEYKLNLHLRNQHPDHYAEENARNTPVNYQDEVDETSNQNVYSAKNGSSKKRKQSKPPPRPSAKTLLSKSTKGKAFDTPPIVKKPRHAEEEMYQDEDSEETEEDRDNNEGWRYQDNNNLDDDNDEETDDENSSRML